MEDEPQYLIDLGKPHNSLLKQLDPWGHVSESRSLTPEEYAAIRAIIEPEESDEHAD